MSTAVANKGPRKMSSKPKKPKRKRRTTPKRYGPEKAPCIKNKIKVNGRCVAKCEPNKTRVPTGEKGYKRCITTRKEGYIFNKLTNRMVLREGPTGKWIFGGKNPKKKNGPSYQEECFLFA